MRKNDYSNKICFICGEHLVYSSLYGNMCCDSNKHNVCVYGNIVVIEFVRINTSETFQYYSITISNNSFKLEEIIEDKLKQITHSSLLYSQYINEDKPFPVFKSIEDIYNFILLL